MAITRTEVSGDGSIMKACLETLVPDYFASVELDSGNSYVINCKDADGNILFKITRSSNNVLWNYTAYKDANTFVGDLSNYSNSISTFYITNNGAIAFRSSGGGFIVTKANDGSTAIVCPGNSGPSGQRMCHIIATKWGDGGTYQSNTIYITSQDTASSTPTGNNTLMVPVPLYGTYNTPLYTPKAFFMPVVQIGMRGVVQEVVGAEGVYVTNGFIALLDDSVE